MTSSQVAALARQIDQIHKNRLGVTSDLVDEQLALHSPVDGTYQTGAQEQSSVLDDLHYHLVRTARHLGMIEALRGTLFGLAGSATV